jgi:hypothetical protein
MQKRLRVQQRVFLVGLAALTVLMVGCGRAKANVTPTPLPTQVATPASPPATTGSSVTSQINAINTQLSAIDNYLGQAKSSLSSSEGNPSQ